MIAVPEVRNEEDSAVGSIVLCIGRPGVAEGKTRRDREVNGEDGANGDDDFIGECLACGICLATASRDSLVGNEAGREDEWARESNAAVDLERIRDVAVNATAGRSDETAKVASLQGWG